VSITLQNITTAKKLVEDIKFIIEKHLDRSISDDTRSQIKSLATKLQSLTLKMKKQFVILRDEFKLFQGIHLSMKNGKIIQGVLVYNRKDGIKTALQEYEQTRQLV
jgi:hypothetical protein